MPPQQLITPSKQAALKCDAPLVGTSAIFSSPSAYAPPGQHKKPVPRPSIYSDARGEIHNILVGGKRINLLYTKAGVMRSGDMHRNTQNDFVFSGAVEIWTMQRDGSTEKTTYRAHQHLEIPIGVPHIFNFVEDCVLAEWWEPFDSPFEAIFYKPYRDLVDASFVPQSSDKPGTMTPLHPPSKGIRAQVAGTLLLGVAIGVLGTIQVLGTSRWRR